MRKEITFYKQDENIVERATALGEDLMNELGVPFKIITKINIVVDELLSNIVQYSNAGTIKFEISIITDTDLDNNIIYDKDKNEVELTITDDGVLFDPYTVEDPDVTLKAEDRQIGGLGIFMVKKFMSRFSYSVEDGKNKNIVAIKW